MKDLIDRKELLKIVEEDFSDDCGWWYIEQIEEAPRVEAEPIKYGRWVNITPVMSSGKAFKCSECGRTVVLGMSRSNLDVVEEYPYCHCGAKMIREDENG